MGLVRKGKAHILEGTMNQQSIHRRPCVGGDEVDAFSPASRKRLAYHRDELRGIKQRASRRERRSTRQSLRFEK